MARKPNHAYEEWQRELAKSAKRKEKKARRAAAKERAAEADSPSSQTDAESIPEPSVLSFSPLPQMRSIPEYFRSPKDDSGSYSTHSQ